MDKNEKLIIKDSYPTAIIQDFRAFFNLHWK